MIRRGMRVGVGQVMQVNGLSRRYLINNQIADKLSGLWSETWGLGGVIYM